MAIVFMEGFDLYSATYSFDQKWGNDTFAFSLQTGRVSGQCLRGSGNGNNIRRTLPGNYNIITHGFAFKVSTLPAGDTIFAHYEDGANNIQFQLSLTSTGAIKFIRGNGAATLGTSTTGVVPSNAWCYIEVAALISATVGTCDIWVDNVSVLSLTGQNNKGYATTANISNLRLTNTSSTVVTNFDDMYLKDVVGHIGDVRIECLYPTSDASPNDWVPSTGTDEFAVVDEATINGDTDYISDATAGHISRFGLPSLVSAPTTIYAVMHSLTVRKDDATARQVRMNSHLSGTTVNGSTRTVSTSYVKNEEIFEAKPGGGAWDNTAVNGLEVSVEVVT